jgi:hypothetical protein
MTAQSKINSDRIAGSESRLLPFNVNVEPLEPGCLDDEPDAHAPPASPEMT